MWWVYWFILFWNILVDKCKRMLIFVIFVWVKLKKNFVFLVKYIIYFYILMVKYLILYDYRNEEV